MWFVMVMGLCLHFFILFKQTATSNLSLTSSIMGEYLVLFHHLTNIQLKCQSSGMFPVTVQLQAVISPLVQERWSCFTTRKQVAPPPIYISHIRWLNVCILTFVGKKSSFPLYYRMFGWMFWHVSVAFCCQDSEEVLLLPVFGLPALLRLTAVHFYISAVKWSFVDWNTLLKTEPQTDGSKKRLPPVLHSH